MKSWSIAGVISKAELVSFKIANAVVTELAEAVVSMVDDINGGGKVAGANKALHRAKGSRLRCRGKYRLHGSLVSDSMMVLSLRAAFAYAAKTCDWGIYMRAGSEDRR